jgi:hypothetical protein
MRKNNTTLKMLKDIRHEVKKLDKTALITSTPVAKYELEVEMGGQIYRMDVKDFEPFMKTIKSVAELFEGGGK